MNKLRVVSGYVQPHTILSEVLNAFIVRENPKYIISIIKKDFTTPMGSLEYEIIFEAYGEVDK